MNKDYQKKNMPVETLESIKIEKRERKEFGQKEAEIMAKDFLEKKFDCIKKVERASHWDDKYQLTDLVAELRDGRRLAIQFSITTAPERQADKAKEVLEQGTVNLHDEYGNVVDKRNIPLVIIHQNKIEWGRAYNHYLKENKESPCEGISDLDATKEKFLEDMIKSLRAQAMRHPREKQIFDSRIEILEEELEEHLKAHKELAE